MSAPAGDRPDRRARRLAPPDLTPHAPVRPGASVAVLAPSSPLRPEMLDAGLAEVRRLGLEPVWRDDILARHRFTAGDDARRLAELSEALGSSEVRALWVARGGHGSLALLRDLDPELLRRDPRPILGESDATALGCWALAAAGVSWVHGPMVAGTLRLGPEHGYDEPSVRAALFGRSATLSSPRVRTLRAGSARGVVVGGCLSLLAALAGTPWLPSVGPKVLLVEDVGVKPYQVHRMLLQLRDAGWLDDVTGVLLGDFTDCVQHADQGYTMDDVFLDFFADAAPAAPVTVGWPVGHSDGAHLAVPCGAAAELRASSGGAALTWRLEGKAAC